MDQIPTKAGYNCCVPDTRSTCPPKRSMRAPVSSFRVSSIPASVSVSRMTATIWLLLKTSPSFLETATAAKSRDAVAPRDTAAACGSRIRMLSSVPELPCRSRFVHGQQQMNHPLTGSTSDCLMPKPSPFSRLHTKARGQHEFVHSRRQKMPRSPSRKPRVAQAGTRRKNLSRPAGPRPRLIDLMQFLEQSSIGLYRKLCPACVDDALETRLLLSIRGGSTILSSLERCTCRPDIMHIKRESSKFPFFADATPHQEAGFPEEPSVILRSKKQLAIILPVPSPGIISREIGAASALNRIMASVGEDCGLQGDQDR